MRLRSRKSLSRGQFVRISFGNPEGKRLSPSTCHADAIANRTDDEGSRNLTVRFQLQEILRPERDWRRLKAHFQLYGPIESPDTSHSRLTSSFPKPCSLAHYSPLRSQPPACLNQFRDQGRHLPIALPRQMF